MNNDYQQDPFIQNTQDQPGNQQDQFGNRQDQFGNQQNQFGNQRDQFGSQQGPFGNQQAPVGNQPNQGQAGMMGEARQFAENQIDQAIDQYANKIPGGEGYTQPVKNVAHGLLDDLEQAAQQRLDNLEGQGGQNQGR